MPVLDLNSTFGALLLGTIISSMLYGAMCLQSWYYFQNYSDGPLMKSAVAALVTLESLHIALGVHAIYYYLVLNYANPIALLTVVWSAAAVIAVTCAIQCIVYIFYIRRVYIVSQRNAPLAIFIAVLELACIGTGIAVPILILQVKFFAVLSVAPKVLAVADISLGLSVAVDIMVAGSLSIYLYMRKTGMSKSDRIVDRMVVHVVNNGIVTSIASVLCLIYATADTSSLIFLMIYQCIGHLYSNTMLSTLNTRKSTSRVLEKSIELSASFTSGRRVTVPLSASIERTAIKSMQRGNPENQMDIEINVQKIVN